MPSIEGFIPVVYPYNENRKTTRKITVDASCHTKNYLGSIVSHDMNPTIISNMNHIYKYIKDLVSVIVTLGINIR